MSRYRIKKKDGQLNIKVKTTSGEKINERELDFFTEKNLRGFFKAKMTRKFGMTSIEYTGPICISLSERLNKPITKYDFFFIMEQIVDLIQKMRVNSLNEDKVSWNIQQVYINEITRELHLIYLPLEKQTQKADLMEFIFSIIYSVSPVPEQNSDYISRFVYFLKGLNKFDGDRIEKFILNEDRSIVNTIKRHYAGQSGYMTDKQRDYYAHYGCDEEETGLLEEEETELLDSEETGLLEDEEETGLLEEDYTHYPTLFRVLTQETISVNKPVFRLGKERSYTDYFVSNNNAVSRSHADIITRESRCYVVDLNSKNRTYINDIPIPVQQETEIRDGDKLRLANEDFIFYY